jgi:16S rRNA (guanine527-N7)-methyltransferase
MHLARIAALLEPFLPVSPPDDALYQHISTYIDILIRWNARINLTAIRDPEEIVTRHFGESLFAASHLFPATASVETGNSPVGSTSTPSTRVPFPNVAGTTNPAIPSAFAKKNSSVSSEPSTLRDFDVSAADLGSGAGFPGLPIKLWTPHLALTLIESNQKKVAFLREIIRSLTLTNVDVFAGRAQDLLHPETEQELSRKIQLARPAANAQPQAPPHVRRALDLVTLRAVERFTSVLPIAASLVANGGRLALLISSSQSDVARFSLPTLSWGPPIPVPLSQSRVLLIGHPPPVAECA